MSSPPDALVKLADAVKQLITLGSAALTLSVAFVHDLAGGKLSGAPHYELRVSWLLMLISIAAGVGALFTFVNVKSHTDGTLRCLAGIQQFTFLASFALLLSMAWATST